MKEHRVPFQNVHYSMGELREPPGRLSFFPRRGAIFSECALFPRKKEEPLGGTLASDLRGDREGTARGLNLEKRDEYL